MKRTLIIGGSVLALGLGFATAAQAAPLPVYATQAECNQDVIARNASVGGPLSGIHFYCTEVQSVPNGVAGCPPPTPTVHDGCIGTFYQVTEKDD